MPTGARRRVPSRSRPSAELQRRAWRIERRAETDRALPLSAFRSHRPQDDLVNIKVNKLSSVKTQLPYEYYHLPFCRPENIVNSAENLGEVLRGDRIENSMYQIEMRSDQQCKVLCSLNIKSKKMFASFKRAIKDEYRVNMILDNLPVAMVRMRSDGDKLVKTYERGYPIGFTSGYMETETGLQITEGKSGDGIFINNHLRYTILYHRDPETDLSRIVGFEVEPFSVKHTFDGDWDPLKTELNTCNVGAMTYVTHDQEPMKIAPGETIIFSYDVFFKSSNIKWASRWDTYLLMMDDQIHWFSIINSAMIVLFLSGMVAMIMLRTLHRDISRYNQLETAEEAQEETGWKLVHGDVFRPPSNPSLLSVFCGTGLQLLGMTCVTMFFAVLGFLSPANRGGLLTAMVFLYVFMGMFAGYFSSRLYKSVNGEAWRRNTTLTAFLFPGIMFAVFFTLNCIIWGEKSSGAVPFGTLFALCLLWFGISTPLVFVGSYFGFKKPSYEYPVRTNKIPRQIPEQPWYMHPTLFIMIGGILPFGAVFIELFFILTSMWLHQFYYIFGFLFLVFIILAITCAEITIVLCYFQLCSEDYNWWWRAFLTAGSSALYMFLYSGFYFYTKLEISKAASGILYFGYMFMIAFGFFLMTGTMGFYSCFIFTQRIYGSVKID